MQYLMSAAEVKAHSIHLGELIDFATYAAAIDLSRSFAPGLTKPMIGLIVQYAEGKSDFFEGTPPPMAYAITPGEWDEFMYGWWDYFSECPAVYAYDGALYTLPI